MPILRLSFALLCAAGLTAGVSAQTKLRPGLWEIQATMKTGSGKMEAAMAQMRQQLATMPPAQRQQMEQMLAQQGMSLPAADGSQKIKVCMRQEDVDLERLPSQEGCTQKIKRTSTNTLHMTFQCRGDRGQGPSTGEGTVTLNSPTAYTGEYRMQIKDKGNPEAMDMRQQGRWLGADCGGIKPMVER